METLYRVLFLVLMPQPEAEEALFGAHALGHDGVRSDGGGVLLPHQWRNNL